MKRLPWVRRLRAAVSYEPWLVARDAFVLVVIWTSAAGMILIPLAVMLGWWR